MKKSNSTKKGPLGTPLGNPVGYFNNSRSVLRKAQEGTETKKKITATSDWAKDAAKSGKSWYSMTDQQRKDYKTNYYKPPTPVTPAATTKSVTPTAPSTNYVPFIGMSAVVSEPKKYTLEKYKKVKASNTPGVKPTTYSFSDTESESSASSRKPYKTKEISAKRYNRLSDRYVKQTGSTVKKDSDAITYGNAKGTKNVSAIYKKGGSVKAKKK
jgi:hypothetical protein